jgi:PhzF family phenazine biosynthesis protein
VKRRPFKQVDVFGTEPCSGNPLAVVLESAGLDDEAMQRLARWTNLSETAFVLEPSTPEADYRVRIFTPTRELPFAGHPTLGTCHAWLEAGGHPKRPDQVVQECHAGLITIRRSGDAWAFAAPPLLRSGPVDATTVATIDRALGLDEGAATDYQWVDNGPGWVAVMLATAAQVLAVEPDYPGFGGLKIGVVGPYPEGHEAHVEVRAFVPGERASGYEDPVTGSLNASLGQWLIGAGLAPPRYVASQGLALGRSGRVSVERDADGQVWVGGISRTLIDGFASLGPV